MFQRKRKKTLSLTETDFWIHAFAFVHRTIGLGEVVILQMGKLRLEGRFWEAEAGNIQASSLLDFFLDTPAATWILPGHGLLQWDAGGVSQGWGNIAAHAPGSPPWRCSCLLDKMGVGV